MTPIFGGARGKSVMTPLTPWTAPSWRPAKKFFHSTVWILGSTKAPNCGSDLGKCVRYQLLGAKQPRLNVFSITECGVALFVLNKRPVSGCVPLQ